MTDVLTPEQRRRNMAAIKGKNTKPEMIVRQLVHGLGYRYRLYPKDLPGKPDLVFPRHRKIIEIYGCYWHMHDCPYGRVVPKTNTKFWQAKRLSTVTRDKKNIKELIMSSVFLIGPIWHFKMAPLVGIPTVTFVIL